MKVLRNGKLVTVKKLKSDVDKKKPVISEEVVAKPEAPEEKIADLPGDEATEKSKYEESTVKELKALLDSKSIEYPKTAKKADLVELADSIEEEDIEPEL